MANINVQYHNIMSRRQPCLVKMPMPVPMRPSLVSPEVSGMVTGDWGPGYRDGTRFDSFPQCFFFLLLFLFLFQVLRSPDSTTFGSFVGRSLPRDSKKAMAISTARVSVNALTTSRMEMSDGERKRRQPVAEGAASQRRARGEVRQRKKCHSEQK